MIQIPDVKIFNAILQVQKAGKIDMFNIPLTIWYLNAVKEQDAAEWVKNNQGIYMQGIIEGFKNDAVEIKNVVNKND